MPIVYIFIAASALAGISFFFKLTSSTVDSMRATTIIYTLLAIVTNIRLWYIGGSFDWHKLQINYAWFWLFMAAVCVFASDYFSLKSYGLGLEVWLANLISIATLVSLSSLVGFLFFKEQINQIQIIGYSLVLVGLVLIVRFQS